MSISYGKAITSTVYNKAHGELSTSSTVGCFTQPTPLVDHGPFKYQSSGNCQQICAQLNQPVFALSGGSNCSCAEEFPPKDSKVSNSKCSHICNGYKESCGGTDTWLVFLTGLSDRDVTYNDSPAPKKGSVSESVVTIGGQTITKTVPGSSDTGAADNSGKSGGSSSNTAGIAVGVVVGIVALIGIIVGVIFFLKRKKRQEAEREYKNRQSVAQFVVGGKSGYDSRPQMYDQRLDPEFMVSRRQSDGSIMDNQDYSRRILQVRNPDGRQ